MNNLLAFIFCLCIMNFNSFAKLSSTREVDSNEVSSKITKMTTKSAFDYTPAFPEFRIGIAYSSISGKGLSVSIAPVKFLKLKVTGYTTYEEHIPGSIDVVNSYGAALNFMIYRVKFVDFYVLAGFNNSEERYASSNSDYYNQPGKMINVTGGIGIGADFIWQNRLVINIETGYHLIRRVTDRFNYYGYYSSSDFLFGPFDNSIFGLGCGISLIL